MDRLISEKEVLDVIASWFESIEQQRILQGRIKAIPSADEDEWVKRSDVLRVIDKRVDEISSEPKWIPVSERLPEWDIECLVVDDKDEFGVGFYRDDVGAWDSPSWGWLERKDDVDNYDAYYMPCGIGKVVAWMPLPSPYQPQERSNE